MSADWHADPDVIGISVDGIAIDARIHRAPDERALVVLVHGFGEHSGRYEEQVNFFLERGITAVTYDLRCHGHTSGPRGRASVATHVADLQVLRDAVTEEFSGARTPDGDPLPRLLFGHSMGGLIAAESAIRNPWDLDGLILSSPGFEVGMETPALLKKIGPVVGRSLGFLPVESLDPTLISRDPDYVRDYRKDRLVFSSGVPAAAAGSMLADGRRMQEQRCRELRVPTLLLHGSGDRITGVEGARRFALDAGADVSEEPVVTYREFDGGYHELFNDLCAVEVYAALGEWLDTRGL